MGFKNLLIELFFQEDLYKIKKEMKIEIANSFKTQLKEKDELIKSKDNLINSLIKENQFLKLKLDIKEKSKAKDLDKSIYPSNLID